MEDFDLELEDEGTRKQLDFADVLAALKAGEAGTTSADVYYGLSDLTPDDLERLKGVWETLNPAYRLKILDALIEISELNFELGYRDMARLGLEDLDPAVRIAAIELLWEDESLEMMRRFIRLARTDEDHSVRAEAVKALGPFILLGELGTLPERETIHAQELAISLLEDGTEEPIVRRRALESLANCSHDRVPDAIREAYESLDPDMRAGALFAMGRTCDRQWTQIILRELKSSEPEMAYEATRAAGELTLEEAIPALSRIAGGTDREIAEIAVWSLGEIGGSEAVRILNSLAGAAEERDDEELLLSIEDAIGNATLAAGDLLRFNLDMDDDLEDDFYDNLDNEDDE